MKTERLMIELEYDDDVMHGKISQEALEWFWLDVMVYEMALNALEESND